MLSSASSTKDSKSSVETSAVHPPLSSTSLNGPTSRIPETTLPEPVITSQAVSVTPTSSNPRSAATPPRNGSGSLRFCRRVADAAGEGGPGSLDESSACARWSGSPMVSQRRWLAGAAILGAGSCDPHSHRRRRSMPKRPSRSATSVGRCADAPTASGHHIGGGRQAWRTKHRREQRGSQRLQVARRTVMS